MSLSMKLGEDGMPTLKLNVPPPLVRSRSSNASSGMSTPSIANAKINYPSVARSGALMKTARKSGYLEIR